MAHWLLKSSMPIHQLISAIFADRRPFVIYCKLASPTGTTAGTLLIRKEAKASIASAVFHHLLSDIRLR